jgi:hypothetical protein
VDTGFQWFARPTRQDWKSLHARARCKSRARARDRKMRRLSVARPSGRRSSEQVCGVGDPKIGRVRERAIRSSDRAVARYAVAAGPTIHTTPPASALPVQSSRVPRKKDRSEVPGTHQCKSCDVSALMAIRDTGSIGANMRRRSSLGRLSPVMHRRMPRQRTKKHTRTRSPSMLCGGRRELWRARHRFDKGCFAALGRFGEGVWQQGCFRFAPRSCS